MRRERKVPKGTLQFIKFTLVGVSNTLISEGIYVVLVLFGVHYLLASFLGFSLSVLNAFYWNQKYVFREDGEKAGRNVKTTFLKTYAAYTWGYLVNIGLLFLFVDVLSLKKVMQPFAEFTLRLGLERLDASTLGKLAAEGLSLVLTVPLNFLLNKYWAFRQKADS